MNIKLTPDQIQLLLTGTVVNNSTGQRYVRYNGNWYLLEDDNLLDDLSQFPKSILKETIFLQDVFDLFETEIFPLTTNDWSRIKARLTELSKHT